MTLPKEKAPFISIRDYLEMERAATEKHAYYQGEVFAMSGVSFKHNSIAINLTGKLRASLKGKERNVLGSDMRMHVHSNTLFTYPDAVIYGGERELLDHQFDTLLNPKVIFGILSSSTRRNDRGEKFNLYRDIPTLEGYVLIDSQKLLVEKYLRQTPGKWIFQEWKEVSDSIRLESVGIELPLSDLYAGVELNPQ